MEIDDSDGALRSRMTRTNDGFNGLELLGVLELTKSEILKQFAGEIKPDSIKRQFIED